jgi:hypothetical protein
VGKIVVTLHFILGVPSLNFNHLIIMKKFHNVFAYYDTSKPKEIKCQINCTLLFSYDVMLEYLCQNNVLRNLLKNANTFNKQLKSFFYFMKFVTSIKPCGSI